MGNLGFVCKNKNNQKWDSTKESHFEENVSILNPARALINKRLNLEGVGDAFSWQLVTKGLTENGNNLAAGTHTQ